ncbi:MAG: multidrug effflux MFS transporter [Pseudomonadales bacterium]
MKHLHRREGEFIALIALMMSLVALSIDAMLPAFPDMAREFALADGNQVQQVIVALFLGLSIGQLWYGPLSDQWGRKPVMLWGASVFLLGTLVCIFAEQYSTLLAGRFLQGLGVAALRVLCFALVRDLYSGAAMARVMSLAMSIFILVPCVAPLLGQSILAVSHWRSIFVMLLLVALMLMLWFWLRQEETLAPSKRVVLNLTRLWRNGCEACCQPVTVRYTLAIGLVQGGFTGYLLSAQQIFDEQYQSGDRFALYFALLALAIGGASALNAKLVKRFDMRRICTLAAAIATLAGALGWSAQLTGTLSFNGFMLLQAVIMFATGLMLGNMNALAMQPLGHIAGVASSAISFISGMLALVIGAYIGWSFDGTSYALMLGVCLTSAATLAIVYRSKKHLMRIQTC